MEEKKIKHVFCNPNSPWKTSYGERAIRTIRERTGRILAEQATNSPIQAVTMAVQSYNSTPNPELMNKAPNEVKPEDVGAILEFQLNKKRNKAESYPDTSKMFAVGDKVRLLLPKTVFTKSNEKRWSEQTYTVSEIKESSWPNVSYKLKSDQTNITLPGSFTFDQLQKIPNES